MAATFQACVTFIAVPFLALVGLLFLCVRKALELMDLFLGWGIAWPPVLVDDLEAEADEQEIVL
jgi:hypothetical protein